MAATTKIKKIYLTLIIAEIILVGIINYNYLLYIDRQMRAEDILPFIFFH